MPGILLCPLMLQPHGQEREETAHAIPNDLGHTISCISRCLRIRIWPG